MGTTFLTIETESRTGLVQARCTCGRLLFKFSTADPAFYVQTKCGKCSRVVEVLGAHYAVASQSSVQR